MTETVVQTPRCDGCDAEVRSESLFCYNCGAAVKAVSEEMEDPVIEAAEPEPVKAPVARPPLRSAASIRKHRRAFNREPVKITWERPADSSMQFVVTTIVLVTGAVVLLVLAFYLR